KKKSFRTVRIRHDRRRVGSTYTRCNELGHSSTIPSEGLNNAETNHCDRHHFALPFGNDWFRNAGGIPRQTCTPEEFGVNRLGSKPTFAKGARGGRSPRTAHIAVLRCLRLVRSGGGLRRACCSSWRSRQANNIR